MKKKKSFPLLLLALSLLLSSCLQPYYSRYGRYRKQSSYMTETIVLTEKIISQYHLSEHDLTELAYFLDKELIIRHYAIDRMKYITPSGELDMRDHRRYGAINFRPRVRGYAVRVWRERTFPFFREIYKIGVSFDDEAIRYLTFSPDRHGRYRLETSIWDNELDYGSREYDCVYGCSDNYLLISARVIQKMVRTRKVLRRGHDYFDPRYDRERYDKYR